VLSNKIEKAKKYHSFSTVKEPNGKVVEKGKYAL